MKGICSFIRELRKPSTELNFNFRRKTNDGQVLAPRDMTSAHLRNCLKVLDRRKEKGSRIYIHMKNILKDRGENP